MTGPSRKARERLETAVRVAAAVRWVGGELVYPPERAWGPVTEQQARAAWTVPSAGYDERTLSFPGLYVSLPRMILDQPDGADAYLDALELEAERLGPPPGFRFCTLYLGGSGQGVFSRLTPAQGRRLLAFLHGRFALAGCLQATAELDALRTKPEQLQVLGEFGVRRLTTLIPHPPRPGDVPTLRRALSRLAEQARSRGFSLLDFDVTCRPDGLRDGTAAAVLEAALAAGADTVHLERRAGSAGPDAALPHPAARAFEELSRKACAHNAKRHLEDADNLQLTHAKMLHGSVFGLGFEALTHARGALRCRKSSDCEAYRAQAARGEPPSLTGCLLTAEEDARAFVIRNLENVGRVSRESFRRIFGAPLESLLGEDAALALELGALEDRGGELAVPAAFGPGRGVAAKLFYGERQRAAFAR